MNQVQPKKDGQSKADSKGMIEELKQCQTCAGRTQSLSSSNQSSGAENQDSALTKNRSSRRLAGRKDADHEFFQMSLISQIMTHKKQKQLIEMQAETDKLFQKCKQSGKPFFEWHDWIMNYIESQLSKYNDFKQSRLSRIFQRGKTKLLERVEARKNKSSVARDSDAQGKK